jgi:hypothetical protein
MTKEELLSQLKGIHFPNSNQPWWHMAPGWYILDSVVLLIIICLVGFYFYWRNKKRIERKFLQRVDDIYDQYQNDCHSYASRISILLKQAVLKSTADKSLMTLHGSDWLSYLKKFTQNDESIELLIQSSYNPSAKFDIDTMNREIRLLYIKLIKI